MSGGRNFQKLKGARNVALRGYEPRGGANLAPSKIRRRKPKSQQRAEAAAIPFDTMMTKIVACRRGHQHSLRIAVSEAAGPFLCADCGEVAR